MSDENSLHERSRITIEQGNLVLSTNTEPVIPDGSRDPKAPTSITGGRVTTPLVDSNRINTDDIIINNKPITGISHEIDDNNPEHIASAYTVDQIRLKLKAEVLSFKNQLNNKILTPVISTAITPPYFGADTDWKYENIEISNGQCIFRNNEGLVRPTQAKLILNSKVFTKPGNYFISFQIERLDSGDITIFNQTNEIIRTIEFSGEYLNQIYVEDPSNYQLIVEINNVLAKHIVIINRIYIYHIEDRAVQYFNYLAQSMIAGDESGLASMSWVNSALASYEGIVNTNVSAIVADITNELLEHKRQRNPHNTTYEDVGAAPLVHSHVIEDFNVAPLHHTHLPIDCGASPIGHTHIPEDCGAAPTVHSHEPGDCGSAPALHNHNLTDLIGYEIVSEHVENKSNPHEVTKEQVGLSNVENYGIADTSDFLSRVSNKYTTPESVGEYLDQVFSTDPSLKYTNLAPKKILQQTISIEPEAEYTIQLSNNSVYVMFIDCKSQTNANCMTMKFPLELRNFENNTIDNKFSNSWMYGTGDDTGNRTITWGYQTTDAFHLLPYNIGNNILKGRLMLDTSMYTLVGEFQTWLGEMIPNVVRDENTNEIISSTYTVNYFSNVIYPVRYQGTLKEYGRSEYSPVAQVIPQLIISHYIDSEYDNHTNPMEFDLTIFELVAVGNSPNLVDTVPLLTIQTFLGDRPPIGWHMCNGDVLDRSKYGELTANVLVQNAFIDENEYDNQVTANGRCNKFLVAEDSIRLPYIPSENGLSYIVKTHMKIVE